MDMSKWYDVWPNAFIQKLLIGRMKRPLNKHLAHRKGSTITLTNIDSVGELLCLLRTQYGVALQYKTTSGVISLQGRPELK